MGNVKTAISIDKPLFEQVDNLANELNTSRSRIFALAAKEFIQRHKNQKLLEAINSAYDDIADVKEESLKSAMRSRHLKMVKDQW
jgi:metal-responsive CopG/Arc/MetJ family transcriptional regulator